MDSGVPGAPGVAVLRPVKEVKQGLETVILLLQLMEEIHVQGMEVSLKVVVKVSYFILCPDCPNSLLMTLDTPTNLYSSTVL